MFPVSVYRSQVQKILRDLAQQIIWLAILQASGNLPYSRVDA